LGRVGRVLDIFEEEPISSFAPQRAASASIRTRPFFVLSQKTTESAPPPYKRLGSSQLLLMRNVSTQSFVRKFAQEHLTDPFVVKAFQKMECDLFNFERKNLTHPEIAFPSKQALEIHIQAYREKYGISIRLGTIDQLPELLEGVRPSFLQPGYASFIIGQDAEDLEDGHVLPLLVSFGGGGMECLLMDVFGNRGKLVEDIHALLGRVVSEDKILIAAGVRQVDGFSCRTGALSLLRNANLSLRYHNFETGLREPIQRLNEMLIDNDHCVMLPSEWTYVEQIFKGQEDRMVIRDCFSKKMEKRMNPRTVKVFREQHTEQALFLCTVDNSKDYRADFHGLALSDDFRADIQEDCFDLIFDTVVRVNTYLLHKGFLRAGLKEIEPLVLLQ
jgi:hypothetical protein